MKHLLVSLYITLSSISLLAQIFYSGKVFNEAENTLMPFYPVFLSSENKTYIIYTNSNGYFNFVSPDSIKKVYTFGYFNEKISYFQANEYQNSQNFLIKILHNSKSYSDTFRLKGVIFNSYDNQVLTNYPITLYLDTIQLYPKITVYSNDYGFYHFTLTLPPDTTFWGINEITTFCNDWIQNRDTLKIEPGNFTKDWIVCHNTNPNLTKIYITGFVIDSLTNQPLCNYPIFISKNSSSANTYKTTQTNSFGLYLDSLLIDLSEKAKIILSTYASVNQRVNFFTDTLFTIDTQKIYVKNFVIPYNQPQDYYIDFLYVANNLTKEVFFWAVSSKTEKFHWNFGDGATTHGNIVSHQYNKEGVYYVKLYNSDFSQMVIKPVIVGKKQQTDGNVYINNEPLSKGKILVFYNDGNSYKLYQKNKINYGSFTIDKTIYGNNLYLAIPEIDVDTLYFPKYLPTFYGDQIFWHQATSVNVPTENDIEINLIKNSKVFYGKQKIYGQISFLSDTDLLANDLYIVLFDEHLKPLDFRKVEDNSFCFNNLPSNIYYTHIIYPGKEQLPLKINLNTSAFISYNINENIIYGKVSKTESLAQDFYVYPNPFADKIYFSKNLQNAQIEIYDLSGKLLIKQKISSKFIDLSSLSEGQYFIKVIENQKITSFKISKI